MKDIFSIILSLYLISAGLGLGCNSKQNVSTANFNGIGEQIRKARLGRELSQEQLADSIQISAAALSLIEDGLASPLPHKLKQIKLILNSHFDWDSSAVVF